MTESKFSFTGKLNGTDLFTVRGDSIEEYVTNLTMATEAIFSEDRSHIFNKRRVGGGLPPSRLGKEDGCGNKKGGKAR